MGEWIFWVPSVRNGVHDRAREEHLPQGNPEVLELLVPLTALSTDFPLSAKWVSGKGTGETYFRATI